MITDTALEQRRLRNLRWEWGLYVLVSILLLLASFLVLLENWQVPAAWRWLAFASALTVYHWAFLWRRLAENRLKEPGAPLLAGLGLANWMTLIRAVFTAALGGFLFGPWPQGWLAWAPAALYLTSSIMDFFDGFVARVTGRTTALGETLDMMWDGAALLLAATLSVRYGQTPVPFLLVGLARYLYLGGIWWWNRSQRRLYELLPSRIRRPFAGMMMGFVAVILMPVYGPPSTTVAAVLFMIPFLIEFLWDWLTVSGQMAPPAQGQTAPNGVRLRVVIPLAARVILVISLVELIVHILRMPVPPVGIIAVAAISTLALVLGAAGRVFALAVLLMAGFGLRLFPLENRFWIILIISTLSMMVGTGRYSLWKPEDWLLYTRAGERRAMKARQ